jgi:hypothetical protein
MNYKLGVAVLLLLALAGLIAGCKTQSSEISASTGREFTLPVGKTVAVAGEKLSIRFISIENDSRCPKGVVCIQAGEARCLVQITLQGASSQATFTDKGGIDGYSRAEFDRYKFAFKVTPYPEAGRQIAPGDYQLIMTVSK